MSRETIMAALKTRLDGAYAWAVPIRRRVKLWSDVPVSERPCAFLFEGGNETYSWSNAPNVKKVIEVRLIAYIDGRSAEGSPQLNAIMDAIDGALTLQGAEQLTGRVTLGGLVQFVRISGQVLKEPGDVDGDGLLLVPMQLTLP